MRSAVTRSLRQTVEIVGWICALAMLSVGARNFEAGLSIDGPLYGAIARNIVRTGDLFRMYGNVPDFNPFTEHPHLGFWIFALAFKVLPAADWAIRVVGHLFYVGFLSLGFFTFRRLYSERAAVLFVLLLWIWPLFSNFFSNAYIDPATVVFGYAALFFAGRLRGPVDAGLAGLFLAATFMTKGLMVLGFLPAFALLFVFGPWLELRPRTSNRRWAGLALCGFLALTAGLGGYLFALSRSSIPDFLALYWDRQMTHRFSSHLSTVTTYWKGNYFTYLLKDTNYLFPLVLLAAFFGRKKSLLVPVTLFVTFYLMFAPTGRVRGQYWLYVLPSVAWLISVGAQRWVGNPVVLRRATLLISLLAVAFIQYLPFRTHGREVAVEAPLLRELGRKGKTQLWLGLKPEDANFVNSCPYAWYGDIPIEYNTPAEALTPAEPSHLYLLRDRSLRAPEAMTAARWCLVKNFETTSLWQKCGS